MMSDAAVSVDNTDLWRRHLQATALSSLIVSALGIVADANFHVIERLSNLKWPAHLIAGGPGIAVLAVGVSAYAYARHVDSRTAIEREARARADFEASESRYRELVERSPDAIVVHVDGRLEYVNPAAVRLMRAQSADQLLGTPAIDRVHPSYRGTVTSRIQRMLESGEDAGPIFEKFLRPDGSTVDVEVRESRVTYAGRTGVQVMLRDLTEREEFERTLKRYELLSEHAHDIVLFVSPEGRILDCNRAAERKYGCSRDKLLTMTVEDIRDPAYRDKIAQQLREASSAGARFETRHLRSNGTSFDVEVDSRAVELEGDSLLISVCRDITARKRAERCLIESERQYRSLIERAPVSSFVVSPDMRIRLLNDAALSLLGMPSGSDLRGRAVIDFLDDVSVDRIEAAAEELSASDQNVRVEEVIVRTADGKRVRTDVDAATVVLDGERCYLAFVRPVSERKKIEIALRQSVTHTARTMARLVAARDPYTSRHQQRVAALSSVLADRMGLTLDQVAAVSLAAEVHDVGKIVVPTELLSKPGTLSEHELALIREHAEAGYGILREIPFPWPIADIVRQHHERLDGSGYPMGIAGDAISIEARIIAVADVVEAVASYRPYRPALGVAKALEIISDGSGVLYDSRVVQACMKFAQEGDSLTALLEFLPPSESAERLHIEER